MITKEAKLYTYAELSNGLRREINDYYDTVPCGDGVTFFSVVGGTKGLLLEDLLFFEDGTLYPTWIKE